MKQFYFLSGLPRSGSTVLAAILNQHPDMHTSSTSGLLDMMFGTFQAWKQSLSSQADASEQAGEAEIKTHPA
jgi:sulfotransferase